MNRIKGLIVISGIFLLLTSGIFHAVLADDHGRHKEEKGHQNEHHEGGDDKGHYSGSDSKAGLSPIGNPAYKETCGACHFVYLPELLPSGSWKKIMAGIGDHFGQALEIAPDAQNAILQYLIADAAENSPAKRSAKIMKSLGIRTPLRITDIPYILEKHHKVSSEILKRKSVGSLSNCAACHKSAENGIYDDDVVIPQ